jgi:hypothetical protein
MMPPARSALLAACLLAACAVSPGEGGDPPGPGPGPGPDPEPAPRSISVTLDGLSPGWLVTTSRLVDHDMPGERSPEGAVTAGGAKAAWFKDSEGNIMALIEDLS